MISHTRTFSALGNYQTAHTLIYSVCGEEMGQRFTLAKSDAASQRQESVLAKVSPREAEQALCYLYENSIPIENWLDILEDLLPAGCLDRESQRG